MMRCALALTLIAAGPAQAADRNHTVTGYDRVVVSGPYAVTIVSGPPGARVSGVPAAIERVRIVQMGRTLLVRPSMDAAPPGRGITPSPTVRLSTPDLSAIEVTGSGATRAARMKGARVQVILGGSGSLVIDRIEAERADLMVSGSGTVDVAGGTALIGQMRLSGSGGIRAGALPVRDLSVTSEGAGAIVAHAVRTAKLSGSGSGSITLYGRPACQSAAAGSVQLVCGAGVFGR